MKLGLLIILLSITEYSVAIFIQYRHEGVYIHFDEGGFLVTPEILNVNHINSITLIETQTDSVRTISKFLAYTNNGSVYFKITHGTWQLGLIDNSFGRIHFCKPEK